MGATDFHEERARLISRRILEELARAAGRLLDDDELGGKYLVSHADGTGYRLGFKEGMGFEISLKEVYRPSRSSGCDHDFLFVSEGYYRCDKCGAVSRDGVLAVGQPVFSEDRTHPYSPEGRAD